MPAVKYGGVSVDHTDKKPYAHARRSTKNSSIGGVAKSKKDFGFDVSYHKEKISGGLRFSKDKDGSKVTVGIRANFAKGGDVMPKRNKKNFRSTKSGAGMTQAGVNAYKKANPGSKLKTAVTGKVKKGSAAANRRKSYCARSAGQMRDFPKAANDPDSRLRQARKRWKC
jgi:hypothetical protein|tara:strand:+ start:231 stop:737 length:507 start_codon:yes stop_codon:yes gene_type:complete